jgi:hypothetical protein
MPADLVNRGIASSPGDARYGQGAVRVPSESGRYSADQHIAVIDYFQLKLASYG